MDKLVKLAIIIGVLLAGSGLFYHYVVFLPEIERAKATAAANEKKEAENQELLRQQIKSEQETQRQLRYQSCLGIARQNYEANWAAACKTNDQIQRGQLKSCLTGPYANATFCKQMYGGSDASPNCSLPGNRADSINAILKQENEQCVTEAKLGLQ